MKLLFFIAVTLTLVLSSICSLVEAVFLSSTTAEVEALKKRNRACGERLEAFKQRVEETSAAILAMNTIANTLGSMVIGSLVVHVLGKENWLAFSVVLTFAVLIFAEVIPKSLGVIHRAALQPFVVYCLMGLRTLMYPFSWLCKHLILFFSKKPVLHQEVSSQEIILLAEKSTRDGFLKNYERDIIANALTLNRVRVSQVMTPKKVVLALEQDQTVEDVFRCYPTLPFSRLPVYIREKENIIGCVRRRDILKTRASHQGQKRMADIMQPTFFIPEGVTLVDALSLFLKHHQPFGIVVDEFGSVAGVMTLEDIFEHILGQEIFEHDDIAIDMRLLAKAQRQPKADRF